MALSLFTAPATEPVSLTEAKLHLRVDGSDDDALITSLIVAAREYAETYTHRAFITQTWDYAFDQFPWGWEPLNLPKAPLVSVTSVSYVDQAGATQTWSTANYSVDAPVGPHARAGRVIPGWSIPYPIPRSIANAITVRFVAGYGSASSVPSSIKAAIKILVATWYEHGRQAIALDTRLEVIPFTVDALLTPFLSSRT